MPRLVHSKQNQNVTKAVEGKVPGPCSSDRLLIKELPDPPQQTPEALDVGSAFSLYCSKLGVGCCWNKPWGRKLMANGVC